LRVCLGTRPFLQGVTTLNEGSGLGRSGGNTGALHMADARSLRKGDAIVGCTRDSRGDVLLRMGDAGSSSRGSRMDDESFVEVEDNFLWRCSGVVDIPCARVWVCCRDDGEGG
jgi:hypothetical protein